MAVARMDHFKIFASKSDTEELLRTLQAFGQVHISNLGEDQDLEDLNLEKMDLNEAIESIKSEIRQIEEAINLLAPYEEEKGLIQSLREGNPNYSFEELMAQGVASNCNPILEDIKELERYISGLNQKIENLKSRRQDLEPWKNLKIESAYLEDTQTTSFITGYINPRQYDILKEDLRDVDGAHLSPIGLHEGSQYALIFVHADFLDQVEEILRKNSFFKVEPFWNHKPNVEILEIDQKISQIKGEIEDKSKDFLSNIENLSVLKTRYEYLNQILVKYESTQNILSTDRVNFIEGYVPRNVSDQFEAMVELEFGNAISFDVSQADDDNPDVPTMLENSSMVEPFESLTEMYSLPKYNEIDPTPFLAPFYWVFFGMMLADFGYGLILSLGAFIALRFNLSDSMRRTMKFFFILGIFTMVWGFIYGSIFGGALDFPNGIGGFIDPAEDYLPVMIISLVLGGIHMFLGLAIGAAQSFKDGEPMAALYDYFSWYMTIGGVIYAILANILGLPGGKIGLYVMFIGMVIIVLFSARDQESTGGRIGMGFYNLYGISSWIGDFVSYLRLLALGLSGAFIGVAINMIVKMLMASGPIAVVLGLIILVGGHIFNLGLSGLSAYVHSLRLTFVEFFDKFYDGNGKPFRKFRSQSKYINIKNQEE